MFHGVFSVGLERGWIWNHFEVAITARAVITFSAEKLLGDDYKNERPNTCLLWLIPVRFDIAQGMVWKGLRWFIWAKSLSLSHF